jgi:hypothetical protein
VASSKKYPEKPLSEPEAQQLKKAVFQGGTPTLPKSWHQGFILSAFPATPYGLQQLEGGPCGIIAAAQCFFLKHLLGGANITNQEKLGDELIRENCLVAAITDMFLKVKSGDTVYLLLPARSFSDTKLDISTLRKVPLQADSFPQLFSGVYHHRSYFLGRSNHGVALLMYSLILSKGIERILEEIDSPDHPLIGVHGHCTQELVNLFITGQATSNCFDGKRAIDSVVLRGVESRSEFGFLSVFETLKYIEVGSNLKAPVFPCWIVSK